MFYKVDKFHFTFLHMDDVWSLNNSKFDDRDHIGDRILKKMIPKIDLLQTLTYT
jgi:hypothetical protein